MPLPKRHSIAVFLAVIMASGVLMPTVHRFQHAYYTCEVEHGAAEPCDAAHHPVAFANGEAGYDIAICALCAFTLAFDLPDHTETALSGILAGFVPPVHVSVALDAPLHFFKRGPPRSA
ncbi:MAG: hypothetical protein ACR2GR_12815 [Rhodothermales bacterium]